MLLYIVGIFSVNRNRKCASWKACDITVETIQEAAYKSAAAGVAGMSDLSVSFLLVAS